jgi:hypothetical protein
MVKNSRSGSGMNIPDHISESLETIFLVKILRFFDADQDPGSGIFLTLYPPIRDGKNSDPVSGIQDVYPGSRIIVPLFRAMLL